MKKQLIAAALSAALLAGGQNVAAAAAPLTIDGGAGPRQLPEQQHHLCPHTHGDGSPASRCRGVLVGWAGSCFCLGSEPDRPPRRPLHTGERPLSLCARRRAGTVRTCSGTGPDAGCRPGRPGDFGGCRHRPVSDRRSQRSHMPTPTTMRTTSTGSPVSSPQRAAGNPCWGRFAVGNVVLQPGRFR